MGRSNLTRRAARSRDFRQPKIEDLGVPAVGYQNVRWFDVAVNDPFRVGGVESVGDLDC